MQPSPPCSAPTWLLAGSSVWATSPLGVAIRHIICEFYVLATSPLGVAVRHVICEFYLFIFPPGYVALCGSKAHQRLGSEGVSWCLETSLFNTPFLGQSSIPTSFLSLFFFGHLYFFLPPFEDNGLLFWVPDVLCQHSEVVLWTLPSV